MPSPTVSVGKSSEPGGSTLPHNVLREVEKTSYMRIAVDATFSCVRSAIQTPFHFFAVGEEMSVGCAVYPKVQEGGGANI